MGGFWCFAIFGRAAYAARMDALEPLIRNLHADGRLRVWSLVITVFGDCVQHRGGRIATARLSRLLGRIGVESGALRTALSRLARDGWVTGRKEGRLSSYGLTARGAEAFGPATARIYDASAAPVREWVFDGGVAAGDVPGALAVAGGALRPAPVADAPRGLRVTGVLAPESAAAIWEGLDPAHRIALERMAEDLVAQELVQAAPLDAAAARVLLVHRWRRLVLRWPDVPAACLPEALQVPDLGAAMARAYGRLSPMAEAWLDAGEGDMAPMPPASDAVTARFRGAESS